MQVDYKKIIGIPREEKGTLVLDFLGVNFLNTFEITELFVWLLQFPFFEERYEIRNPTDVVSYLHRINFFVHLENKKNLHPSFPRHSLEGKNNWLIELQVYRYKNGFYGDYEKICLLLKNIGVSRENISLIASSLGEVVDNAFTHNLGKWNHEIGPLGILLSQTFHKKRELCFSFCDLGIGFLETLKSNYPTLSSQGESIALAIQPNITGRPQRQGGNGLDYLKKNVFNGFRGDLYIRSGDTLYSVREEVSQRTPFLSGVNIFFTLFY